jgi:hypothetical protein
MINQEGQPHRAAPTQSQLTFEINLTVEEEMIWEIIGGRQGKERAILGPEIEERTQIEYDRIRMVISHLINRHGKLIASCGMGYYIPVSRDEIIEATKSLRHRGIAILWRSANLQKTSLEEVFGQARMEFDEKAP